jgi:photosystem II stability/assembly factor-like uncharacterized protein
MHAAFCLLVSACLYSQDARPAAETEPEDRMSAGAFEGLRLRGIGPTLSSGRITSLAVNPANPAHYFAGVASGGVLKTTNSGTTFTPVFDEQGSYSIGHIALDPRNPNTVWVGTGENNAQRSVSFGDGVYRSDDGGRSWRNTGLKESRHIGRIVVDPRDSNVVYVAAQGPLWGAGGDRGLYKTTDGGKTWKRILNISEHTGVTDVALDPSDPDTVLAASWQRRRHVFTLINGGPESALYKSHDGGKTFAKVRGLPNEDLGRIGLAFSPSKKGLVYARVEAANRQGGIYRSLDHGESWEKRSSYDGQGMYYGQIIADPSVADRFYLGDVAAKVSDDGGRTLRNVGDRAKHVDTHTFWIDPGNSDHLLSGCDGGLYESFDRGQTWQYKTNLPTLQFYDVTVDNSLPHYYIYGGTQDNFSMGGPSRTRSAQGIVMSDWFVTNAGDGFQSRVDPDDPNTVYSESQYGGLVRFDRRTGERVGIKPVEGKGEPPLRFNWDSPLLISPHSSTRLYFAANRIFRSDDRGSSWKAISPDLTRQIDRDSLPVMGKIWYPDAMAKHQSTSFYGNITALHESPKREGLIYAGTDDGLIQVTENGGGAWRKIDAFPGVPERTYVARVLASQHAEGTVYAAFENHKNNDFKPYLLKSTDKGATWTAIHDGLPGNGPVLAIAEDHVNPNLLFAGTEFGLYFTVDGGGKWIRLRGGLPTIAVRDLAIQKRENDLVLATFGRGFYVLDDYTPLRLVKPETLDRELTLFPVKTATAYVEAQPLGSRGKAWQGETYFTAENPPYGAVFTYYLRDTLQTGKQKRQQEQKKADREERTLPYPSMAQLSTEETEEPPAIAATVSDSTGKVVRRISGPATRGFHRIAWDLRTPPPVLPPPRASGEDEEMFAPAPRGHLVAPGTYQVSLATRINGVLKPAGEPQKFTVQGPSALQQLSEFQSEAVRLSRAASGAVEAATGARTKLAAIVRALDESAADPRLRTEARRIDSKLHEIQKALRGDEALARYQQNLPPTILDRVTRLVSNYRMWTGAPHKADLDGLKLGSEELKTALAQLRTAVDNDLRKLERELEAAGAPHSPGRIPELR